MDTFFKTNEIVPTISEQETVDIGDSPLAHPELMAKITNEFGLSEKAKQFIKVFLEQAKCTALVGAVVVNHVILVLTMMGHKFSVDDHKRLEYLLLSYWGVRGGSAAVLELTGLKNKAPYAIAAYTLTETNVTKLLAFTSFIRRTPLPLPLNLSLQLLCSLMLVKDEFCSAKALVQGKKYPSGGHYEQIKTYFEGHMVLTFLAVVEEMVTRAIQVGATTYTAGYALADVFVDSESPVDPANQEQILMSIALVMALLGAFSVAHPITTQIANHVRSAEINAGLVLLPLVSLLFDFIPTINFLVAGGLGVLLAVFLPFILELTVHYWESNKEMVSQKPIDEMRSQVEEVIDEESHLKINI